MRFSRLSIKCSAAPPCFRLLPSERLLNQIVEHSSDNVVGSWEEPPDNWLTAAKNAFVGWAFNFRVRMLLKSAVKWLIFSCSYLQTSCMKCNLLPSVSLLHSSWPREGLRGLREEASSRRSVSWGVVWKPSIFWNMFKEYNFQSLLLESQYLYLEALKQSYLSNKNKL